MAIAGIINTNYKGIDNTMFMMAANQAIFSNDVPQYLIILLDAQNSFARDNLWECTLYLSLCIDMARQTLFLNKFPYTTTKNKIVFDNSKLNETDLLKVLNVTLKYQCNRSLEREQPLVWSSFKDLFLTRHQLAHGKNKANVNGQLIELTPELVESWIKTTIYVIMFIQDVCDAPLKISVQEQKN